MSDPTTHDGSDHDPASGLPDDLPGGPDDEAGHAKPLVEDDDLDADEQA